MFEMTTEKVFHADDKYVLRLLNVVIHEHQFKRKGKYYKWGSPISFPTGGACVLSVIRLQDGGRRSAVVSAEARI
jgi:hypothetical protein